MHEERLHLREVFDMKIIEIEYGELRSTERYGNVCLHLRASLEKNDNADNVREELKREVKKELDREVKRRNAAAMRTIKKLTEWEP